MRSYSSALPEGTAPRENPLEGVSFELDGEVFECKGTVSTLDLSELASAAVNALDSSDPAGMAIVSEFLKAAFGPEVYRAFRYHTRTRKTPDDVLLEIITGIVEEVQENVSVMTARPTNSPSRYSRGLTVPAARRARLISLATGDVQEVSSPPGPGTGEDPEMDPALAAEREEQARARAAAKKPRPRRVSGRAASQTRR
jgi:hypothetical protein